MNDILIRFAQQEDINLILELIRELAEFENLEHQVTATPELLNESLFGERNSAEVLIAESGQKPVAFSLFFHNYSTFLGKNGIYIEDIYVRPDYRSRGIGKALFSHIAELAIQRNCGRIEWSVLDWNRDAIRFYRDMGAVAMEEWTVYRLVSAQFHDLIDKDGQPRVQ